MSVYKLVDRESLWIFQAMQPRVVRCEVPPSGGSMIASGTNQSLIACTELPRKSGNSVQIGFRINAELCI